ncbi:MAG: hypothetical protein HXX81_06220, partial [Campylobacterales bacterium]|nr:hypothetical protein [Campylobacterales bacterium]
LMNECDFAIIAGGTTSLETAFIKLPSMVVVTAQNQEKIAKYLDRQGLAFCVETIENLDENKLSNLINIFVSKKRDKIYQNLLNRQNHNGALNVANIIKKHLLKIAFVSDSDSWINQKIKRYLAKNQTLNIQTFHDYSLVKDFDVVFLLSYSKIIDEDSLKKNSLNLVVHASDLPDGKGMSPLSWQILEGKCEIIITIFEAISKLDSGDWFFKDVMKFTGYELIDELREMVDIKTFELIDKVLNNFSDLKRNKQIGDGKIYQRRTVLDSKLDINKSIKEQFNLLRIVDNEKYPAFFEIDGHKYILKIEKGS